MGSEMCIRDSPSGKLSITAAEGLRSRPFLGQPKMAIPVLKRRGNFDNFSRQMLVYTKLHGIENVFDTDEYVDVEADGNDKESLMAQGVSGSMYKLMAWLFLSQALQPNVDKARFHRSTSPRRCWRGS